VQVVLESVADRAVALQRHARGELRGVGASALAIEARTRAGLAPRHAAAARQHRRAGELEAHRGLGEVVLDRLEAAYRRPNCWRTLT
jgi:hypothetical protein